MENLKEVSIGFAAISSIVVIILTTLLLLRKLKPVGRRYVDKPHIYVFVGFWSYVAIHYSMVYAYRSAASMSDQSPEYFFDSIERGVTKMATTSLEQLKDLESFTIETKIGVDGTSAVEEMVSKIGVESLEETASRISGKALATEKLAELLPKLLNPANLEKCPSGISSDRILHAIGNLSHTAKEIAANVETIKPKSNQISTELVKSFESDAVSMEVQQNLKTCVEERKSVLSHFIMDMKNMEYHRKEIVADIKPKTVNKIWWIRQFSYAQIFITLAISALIYLGFSRMTDLMSVRWPTRLCALSVPLSGANVLLFSMFIGWLSVFQCPAQVKNIGLHSFTSKWKSPTSNGFSTRICQSGHNTLFGGLSELETLPMSIDEISNQMTIKIEKSQSEIENLKIEGELFLNAISEIRELLTQFENFDEECLGAQASAKLPDLIVQLEIFLVEGEQIKKVMDHLNGKFDNGKTVLEPLVQFLLKKTQISIETSIKTMISKMEMTDLACDSIERMIKKGQRLVCLELDVDLDDYWIVVDVILFFLVALFGLNTVVYRTIALWELEHHSPQPPPPPQRPVRVLRRFRARRLNPTLF